MSSRQNKLIEAGTWDLILLVCGGTKDQSKGTTANRHWLRSQQHQTGSLLCTADSFHGCVEGGQNTELNVNIMCNWPQAPEFLYLGYLSSTHDVHGFKHFCVCVVGTWLHKLVRNVRHF